MALRRNMFKTIMGFLRKKKPGFAIGDAMQYVRGKIGSGYFHSEFTSVAGEKTREKWLDKTNLEHMNRWKLLGHSAGLLKSELLTPAAVFAADQKEFSFLQKPTDLPDKTIQSGFERLAPWTYHVETERLSTRSFGTYNEKTIAFHQFRNSLICDAIERFFDSEMSNLNLLDLGCNCGFFSLEMANRGVGHCLGIDLRSENIAQAQWLASLYGIKNAAFRTGNVKTIENKPFDVVLNLGLMYHLSTPYEVMESCYRLTKQVCVIDSICHTEPFSGYHVVTQKNTKNPLEGDLSFELQPTYRGLLDTIYSAGFSHVVELFGSASHQIELYNDLSRRCFLAFKNKPEIEALNRISTAATTA